jgi:hypothetical protein
MALACHIDAAIDAIGAELVGVAPVARTEADRVAHSVPPRFHWRDGGGETSPRGASCNGGPEPTLQEDAYSHVVDCWGATKADAFALRNALIQATRNVMQGRNYAVGRFDVTEPMLELGYQVSQQLTLYLMLPELDLPTVAPAAPADGQYVHPSAFLSAKTHPEATLETMEFDTSAAVVGDGILTAGEG